MLYRFFSNMFPIKLTCQKSLLVGGTHHYIALNVKDKETINLSKV